MNIETELTKYIVNTNYDALPDEVVDSAKKCIVDTLGVAIAGSKYSVSDTIVNQIKDWGGKEESTILIYGGKVPCQNAALANATMARTLDLGCVHETAVTHPAETVVPAALAIAEREKGSGKDLITAVTVGIDLTCRWNLPRKKFRGFVGESLFGASAAAAKLLKLSEEETLNALGIALCLAAGTYQMVLENTSYMHVSHGMKASSGILSGLLAQQGVTGPKNLITGDYGFYSVYENREDCELDELTRELGERFEVTNVSIKPYPTCKYTHTAIYATLGIVRENHVRPEDIDEIAVRVNQAAYEVVGSPLDKKRVPTNPIEAQFSIPFLLGVAVSRGDVFIDDVTDTAIENTDFLAIAKKVKTMVDADIEKASSGQIGPAIVEITTRGGRKFQKRADFVIGHPQNPMSFDQVVEKFRKCSLHAARPLDKGNTDKSIEMLGNLEKVHDVSSILDLLT